MPTQFPFYLRQTGQASPATAGFLLGLLTLAGGFAALAFGRVRAARGQAATPALGSVLMAAGFFVLWGATGRFGFAVGAALIGSGFAFIIPAVVAWTLDIAPMRRRGLASGCATTAIFLGQFDTPLLISGISDPCFCGLSFFSPRRRVCSQRCLSDQRSACAQMNGV